MVLAAFTWQTGLSLGALVVAGISLVVAGISVVYAHRADARAGRAEQRSLRGHPRVVRETGRDQPTDGPRSGQVVYEYEVHNDGHAVITELWLWIEDSEGNPVSTSGGGPVTFAARDTMLVGNVGLTNRHATGLRLMVRWTDLEGEHDPEWTGLRPIAV